MKTETYICAAIAALMIFSLFSCRKTWDYIKDHPKTELKFCNIKKIADPASDWKEMVFTYNALGNPISILPIVDIDYGIPAYFFKYDKYNRLIAFAQAWNKDFSFMPDQGACENFHKYVYLSNGNVIDSFFQSAWFGPNGEAYNGGYVSPISEIEFDALGRINKRTVKDFDFDPSTDEYIPPPPPIPPVTHYTYNYDSQGNLTSIANDVYGEQLIPHPYNNRVNILRTNKIWMFINKNYSQNGVAAAPEYDVQGDSNFNCYGLPQTISPVNFEQFIFSYGSATGSIEYMCNCNDSASK